MDNAQYNVPIIINQPLLQNFRLDSQVYTSVEAAALFRFSLWGAIISFKVTFQVLMETSKT
jgi:hypothetical protein